MRQRLVLCPHLVTGCSSGCAIRRVPLCVTEASVVTHKSHSPRSSNGSGSRFFNPQIGVRLPYGVLNRSIVEN